MTTDQLPADSAAEREVLVAMLQHPKLAEVRKLLSAEYFLDPAYSALADEAIRQQKAGGIDPQLIARNLKSHRAFSNPDESAALMLELLNEYASRHQFPNKCASIVETYRKRQRILGFGKLLHAAQNGNTSDEIDREALSVLTRWRQESIGFGKRERFTFGDLRSAFPTLNPPIVNGLLRRGETANIISVSKIGKSWLGYSLALAQITGRKWLDRFETSGGKVLLVDNELHPSTLAYRIPVVGKAMGIHHDEYRDDLEIWPLRGRLRSLAELSVEFEALEPGEFSIILLDAKYRFATAGVSENENSAEAAFYNEVDRLAERTGAAIVLIHHSSKGSQSDKRVTDVGSGAGAQSRAADAHLVLREHEEDGVCVFDAAVRSFAPVEPLALRWTFPLWLPTEADPSRLKRPAGRNEQRQADADREGIDATIKALRDGPATARQIRRKTGFGEYRQNRMLDLLTSKGHAVVKETKTGETSHAEYMLSE